MITALKQKIAELEKELDSIQEEREGASGRFIWWNVFIVPTENQVMSKQWLAELRVREEAAMEIIKLLPEKQVRELRDKILVDEKFPLRQACLRILHNRLDSFSLL